MANYNGTPNDDIYYGDGTDETIHGNGGNDTLDGRGGNDTIYGDDGDDRIEGGDGSDIMDGGAGDDIIAIVGLGQLAAGDQVIGGSGYDMLYLRDDNYGTFDLTGNTITGMESLLVYQGIAKLTVAQFNQFQLIKGMVRLSGSGNFDLTGGKVSAEGASFYFDSGNDWASLVGVTSANTLLLSGGGGNDTLLGSNTIDILLGGDGNDTLEGNGGNDSIAGDAGDDIMRGGAGNDSFFDDLGDDQMYGDSGDDTFEVDITAGYSAGDLVDGGAGGYDQLWVKGGSPYVAKTLDLGSYSISNIEALTAEWMTVAGSAAQLSQFQLLRAKAAELTSAGTLTVGSSFQVNSITASNLGNTIDGTAATTWLNLIGGTGTDTLLGGSGDDLLDGGGGNDTLRGGDGNDTLVNSAGADVMEGGAGNDTFRITTGIDAGDIFRGGTGSDAIRIEWPDSSYWDTIYDLSGATLDSIEQISGGRVKLSIAQVLGMASGIDVPGLYLADGGTIDLRNMDVRAVIYLNDAGNTLLTGQPNYYGRYVYGGIGNDTVTGIDGADNFHGGGGSDRLDGGAGDDELYGEGGNDVLIDGAGNDVLSGGAGDDLFIVAASSSMSDRIDGGEGIDTADVRARGDIADLDTFGCTGMEFIIGNVEVRTNGIRASQLMGVDAQILRVSSAGSVIMLNNGFTGHSIFLSNEGHTVDLTGTTHSVTVTGGAGVDSIKGTDAGDLIYGLGGNDSLNGGLGADHLHGGAGDDSYTVDRPDDLVFELAGEGTDTVYATAGYYLFGNIENLTLVAGAGDIFGVGNELANTMVGNEGANLLIAGAGDDIVRGGAGADILYGQDGVDQLFGEAGSDTLLGGAGNDMLYGGAEVDTLFGEAGDDLLSGGDGADYLLGGADNDTLYGGNDGDALYGEAGNDQLYGEAGIDYLLGGAGNDTLSGGNDADALYGEDGDDTLLGGLDFKTDILGGGAGNDILRGDSGLGDYDLMDGGGGDDAYYVDTGDDLTFEAVGGGTDTVYANVAGANNGVYLYANVENLVILGSTTFGVGNELANMLTGNAAGNWLLGGAGNDTLNGKAGNDVLFGEGGADTFVFEQGNGGDVIGDFVTGTDKIDLSAFGLSWQAIVNSMHENAGTTAIDLGNGNLIVLNGVASATLQAGDFILSAPTSGAMPAAKVAGGVEGGGLAYADPGQGGIDGPIPGLPYETGPSIHTIPWWNVPDAHHLL